MTENTKKRLPGIIERIDELRDEVEKILGGEFEEYRMKGDAMSEVGRVYATRKIRQIQEAYASLDDASRLLANF